MALLAEGEKYGAQLRTEFESRTGGTWPLNVGQVYTTLDRLARDGLVESAGEQDAEGRIAYRLTAAGHTELATWWSIPVDRTNTPRDELTIKLALAVSAPGVDVKRVVQTQRTATLSHLHDLTRLKRESLVRPEGPAEGRSDGRSEEENALAWLLVLENLVFAAETEVRWLDHVETMLARRPSPTASAPGAAARTDDATSSTTTRRQQPAADSSTSPGVDHS